MTIKLWSSYHRRSNRLSLLCEAAKAPEGGELENVQLVRDSVKEIYGDNDSTHHANYLQTANLRYISYLFVVVDVVLPEFPHLEPVRVT